MKMIKVVTAPYKYYNNFIPPITVGMINQHLFLNKIDFDTDDLDIKLHFSQKNKSIDLNITQSDIKIWDSYILGEKNFEIEKKISKIAKLTNFEGYSILLFSAFPPPLHDIPDYLIVYALFRYLKNKYDSKIITNVDYLCEIDGIKSGIVDKYIHSIPALFNYLKKEIGVNITTYHTNNFDQNLEGLPIRLYSYEGITVAGYLFFNGCPNKCNFCPRYFKDDNEVFKLPDPKRVVYNLKNFIDKYNLKYILLLNSTINPSKIFAYEIAKNIINQKLEINFGDCATFNTMDIELLNILKKAGCVKLVFGLETASQRLQKRINKIIKLDHVEKIIKHCYNIGIWVDITLLCGLPHETYYDIYLTLLFIKKNYKYLRGLNLNRFTLQSGSEYLKHPNRHGIILKENWKLNQVYSSVPFDEESGMDWNQKRRYIDKVYYDFISSIDPKRVDFLRPVNHIFKVISNNCSVDHINHYIDNIFLDQDTTKLEKLINKYKKLIDCSNISY